MAKRHFFVAGTDTDAGKTRVSAGLLHCVNQRGLASVGLKPIAAGCEPSPDGLRNSDALILQQTANVALAYESVNPIALEPAIAPHIAAEQLGRRLSADRVAGLCRGVMMERYDVLLIEGAGGWRVPLNERETYAHVAKALQTPVILVVGMKLGCINHALLTVEAIARDGLPLAGWVANRIDPDMACYDENVATLKRFIGAPLLGEVPFLAQPDAANVAQFLNIDVLLE